ncbi:DsrE family protein [Candidatus Pyrohabitans sp.]
MAERLVFVLTTGLNSPGVTRATLMFSAISAAMDVETTLFCVQDGAEIMVRGALDREESKTGVPTIKQRLEEAIEAGVEILVCEQTIRVKGISEDELIEEAKVSGAATLIDLALEAKNVLCLG